MRRFKIQNARVGTKRRMRGNAKSRSGSILILSVAFIVVLLTISGLSINLAYMEMIRSEQRLATDAASKAASITLANTQSIAQARTVAKRVAAYHSVGGRSLTLSDRMIKFGVAAKQGNGSYSFSEIANPTQTTQINSVQINSDMWEEHSDGRSLLVFSKLHFENPEWNLIRNSLSSTVTKLDLDLCLVVDRSGSMSWDLSNTSFSYPPAIQGSKIQKYVAAPDPTLSRWAVLSRSTALFLSILKENPFKPRVALATYSSNFDGQQEDYARYYNSVFRNPADAPLPQLKSVVSSLDQSLTTGYASVSSKLIAIGKQPLVGDTNIAAGLREGVYALTGASNQRITASKHIILFCDGMMTEGDDPVAIARLAKAANIKISTIAFSDQANRTLMQNIATAGGGDSYFANSEAQLQTVFKTIAQTLPSVLTN